MHVTTTTTAAAAVAILSVLPAVQAGIYTKNSPVLQVNAKTFDQLIAKSNYTSIVEFFAPWCGHCQNLKPAYEKAARNLDGLAQVAAIDCDDDANKPFCSSQGVQGFPTLKIVRPGKKTGRPVVEDYKGPRTATGIVDAVVAKINNHVTKVTDADLDVFLADGSTPKALLFTEKGTMSPLIKSIAIDFLGVIKVGQVRNKEAKVVEKFGIDSFPTLLLFPGGDEGADAEPIKYDGELKKEALVQFLSQAGAPNPPNGAAASKAGGSQQKPKESKEKTKKGTEKAQEAKEAQKKEKESEADSKPSPSQQTAPVIVESAVPIPTIHTPEKLTTECLHGKAHLCILAFVPAAEDGTSSKAQTVLGSLSELAHKHAQSKRHLFPMYALPDSNEGATSLLQSLGLESQASENNVVLLAVNARRGWWRHYDGDDFSQEKIGSWIDAIRMSEGEKKPLPEGVVVAAAAEEKKAETEKTEKTETTEEVKHEEL